MKTAQQLIADAKASIAEVTAREVQDRLAAGEPVVLIDLREQNEWNLGHAAPAQYIGRGVLDDGSFSKGESTGANRYAITFGMNYRFDENTTFKAEYRFDGADQEVFEYVKNNNFRKYNQLFGASVVVSF